MAIGTSPYPELPSVFLQEDSVPEKIRNLCLREQCTGCLLLCAETPDDTLHLYGEKLRSLDGRLSVHEVNLKIPDFEEQIRRFLSRGTRVLLLHYNQYTGLIRKIRAEYPESVVTLSCDHPLRNETYHGYSVDFPWESVAESAVSLLREVMTDRSCTRRIVCAPEILHWE